MMLAKFIFNIGQQLRNPSLKNWFLFLKKSESWSLEQLEAYQLKQLKTLLQTAYKHSTFYRDLWNKAGVHIEDVQSLGDLKKLPSIAKEDLLKFNNEIHTGIKFNKVFKANTSGTSGASLKFNREESADAFNRAAIFRGYSWYKVQPWERNGYFWGFNFKGISKWKTRLLDAFQNRFRIFSYQSKDLEQFSKKLQKAKYLHGYASMIYGLAQYFNANKLPKPKHLKMIKGTSEKIFEGYQSEIKKAFGLKMISEYGAAETGIIAFECPQGNMHLNMEGVIVEEAHNEIIVTNLQMTSFPIIRYRLGDYIKLAPKEKKCTCGLQHLMLEEVTGRIGAVVYGITATFPSLYFYYIFKNLAQKGLPLNYQIQQHKKGELLFLIEQKLAVPELKMLEKEIETYFKNDITFTIEGLKKDVSKNKKMQSFISTIS